ncbi:Pyruvate decarboxylase 1, partial [Tulasnella sp. JGI-2019a]
AQEVSYKPLNTSVNVSLEPDDPEVEAGHWGPSRRSWPYASKEAASLVVAHAIRHCVMENIHEFMDKSLLSAFTIPMSKSAVDETNPAFRRHLRRKCVSAERPEGRRVF